MEYRHIKDIDFKSNINGRVFGIFLARDVELKTNKDGVSKYLDLNMCDKDLKINAKKWGATDEDAEKLVNGGVYLAAIDVKPYAKSPLGYSCTLYNYDKCNEDPSNFIEWAEGMDEAQTIIQNALTIIAESPYKDLVYNLLIDNWKEFCIWSAASGMHHNMMGGLIVHTAEVIEQSEIIADMWENKYGPGFINKPLLLSGALIHDIGKVRELNVDATSGSTTYSKESALETHISLCISMIEVEAYKLKLGYQIYRINEINEQEGVKTPEQLIEEREIVQLLKHLVLAHHGQKEYGSPISMNTPEAVILHEADVLSAEMFRFNKVFNNLEPGEMHSVWLGKDISVTYKESSKP